MLNICKPCATIRGMELNPIQKPITCDLCGTKQMCCSIPVTDLKSPEIAFESGYFHSDDLSKSIALVKSRKAVLLPRIKMLQLAVSKPNREISLSDTLVVVKDWATNGLTRKTIGTTKYVLEKIIEAISDAKLDTAEVATKKLIEQNLNAELSGLNEKEKELSVLFQNCIDRICLNECRIIMGTNDFNKAFERSKKVYKAMQK